MRLSLIFELLLIFILIAFAASRVIDDSHLHQARAALRRQHHQHNKVSKVAHKKRQQVQDAANKYCSCNAKLCNCCREFNLPVVALQGPGCASLQYLRGDRLAISMSFGERVLTNTTIDSRKPKPVCMPLPGGVSKFCGRVYNIGRQGEDFNACLGLELRAVQDVEAALRVSCFRFGPKGLKVEPSQPLPAVQGAVSNNEDDEDDDDDDDDDDEFDFDDVGDIEDDDDDDDEDADDDDGDNSVDYGTFSVFDDDFIDSLFVPESGGNKRKKIVSTTRAPFRSPTKKTIIRRKPIVPGALSAPPKGTTATKVKKPVTSTERIPQKKTTIRRRTKPTPQKTTASVQTSKITLKPSTKEEPIHTTPLSISTKSVYSTITQESTTSSVDNLITKASSTTPSTTVTTTTASTTTTTPAPMPVALVTSATIVTSENKPVLLVDSSTPEKGDSSVISALEAQNVASNEVIASPHESIAAVTAMLQNVPGETETKFEDKLTAVVEKEPTSIVQVEEVSATSGAVTVNDYSTQKEIDTTTEIETGTLTQDTTPQQPETTLSPSIEESTTSTSDDDDEEDTVTLQSFIIKNGEDDGEEEDETTESASTIQASVTDAPKIELKINTSNADAESKDILGDIIDGVADTIGGDDSSEEDKDAANDDEDDDDDDDDLLGDDDDDDEDEEEEDETHNEAEKEQNADDDDDDDDDDDFAGRKAKQQQKVPKNGRLVRGRQSRDMWLDRLHW